ncbi:MAG TPA: hypothetical protein PK854_04670 [Oscillospiraceae bacterium]|nr:hypothetical protein [Oscillospiraceae bacterium]HPS34540.1 hypothetical protein [Oscillospiraceae bacterium]
MTYKRIISVFLTATILLVGLGGCVSDNAVKTNGFYKIMQMKSVSELNESAISSLDQNITALNLSMYSGTLEIRDICFFEDDLIGVLLHGMDQIISEESTELNFTLIVFSILNMNPLYQVLFKTQPVMTQSDSKQIAYSMDFVKSGENQALVLSRNEGWAVSEMFFAVTKTGVTEISRDQVYSHRLSDSVSILEDQNNLVLKHKGETETLLSGFYYIDPNTVDDPLAWENYSFFCRLDNNRFVYEKYGWEWLDETGIFDLETGESTSFVYENVNPLRLCTTDGSRIVLTPERDSGFSSYGPYLYDDTTGEVTDLDWLDYTYMDEIEPDFFLVENTLVAFIDDSFTPALRLFDLETKTEKSQIDFSNQYNLSQSRMEFMISGKYLYFFSLSWSWNSFLFRIPIGEVTKR